MKSAAEFTEVIRRQAAKADFLVGGVAASHDPDSESEAGGEA